MKTIIKLPLTPSQLALPKANEFSEVFLPQQVQEMSNMIASVEVTDASSCELVKQNVSQAKKIQSAIEKKRMSITAPMNDVIKNYIAIEKHLNAILDKIVTEGNAKVIAYANELRKKQLLEEQQANMQRLQKQQFLDTLRTTVKESIDQLTTCAGKSIADLTLVYNKNINLNSSTSKLGALLVANESDREVITRASEMLIAIGRNVKSYINKTLDQVNMNQLNQRLLENYDSALLFTAFQEPTTTVSTRQVTQTVKGTYTTISFEIIDESLVPDQYTKKVVDEAIIKLLKEQNADAIIAGTYKIPGIKFTYEQKIRG